MDAVILLSTNPGSQKKAYGAIKEILEEAKNHDIVIESITHCFGRVDGVVVCKCEDLMNINAFAEAFRRDGFFNTETLIGIE